LRRSRVSRHIVVHRIGLKWRIGARETARIRDGDRIGPALPITADEAEKLPRVYGAEAVFMQRAL